MVAITLAPIAGLIMVAARITDPVLKPEVFNKWYSDIHVRDMINNNFASIGLRYSNYTINGSSSSTSPLLSPSTNYLALYNVDDINVFTVPGNMDKLPLTSDLLPDKTKTVLTWSAWDFTYWLPTQIFEGNSTATERPKYVLANRIEPAAGGDEDLDQWYRKEHLGLLSTLPSYRRTTRYKSSNGSKPRYLALHEVDDLDAFMNAGDVVNTAWTKKIIDGAKTFESSTWKLFLNKGNQNEKLGV